MQKPIKRSAIRQVLGREYFILKRRMHWLLGNEKWSRQSYDSESLDCLVFNHCSLIMRPLKEVDMHLQRNKRTNLKLAIAQINNTVIHPGEFFSFWKQVGRPTRRKGYLDGLVLKQGQVQKGVGGGAYTLLPKLNAQNKANEKQNNAEIAEYTLDLYWVKPDMHARLETIMHIKMLEVLNNHSQSDKLFVQVHCVCKLKQFIEIYFAVH